MFEQRIAEYCQSESQPIARNGGRNSAWRSRGRRRSERELPADL
jgi:hypothetical protein